MYLTAQRVVNDLGQSDVAVFWYTHDGAVHSVSGTAAEFATFADSNPGRLLLHVPTRAVHEAPAYVLSYLDVLAPDGRPIGETLLALDIAVTRAPPGQSAAVWAHDGIALRFYVHPAVGLDLQTELRRLKDEIKVLVGVATRGATHVSRPPQPIKILMHRDHVGYIFRLDDDSRTFLERVLSKRLPGALSIPHATKEHFEATFVAGDPFEHYVVALTQMELGRLRAMTSVVVLDIDNGIQVWPLAGAEEA